MLRRMKFFMVFLFIGVLLFTITQGVMAADNPTDVPSSHWAYKAVKLLVDKGYLQLYQDQTFQGDKSVDRYTLAAVVAKILNEIAAGQVGTSKEDVALLKSLTNEFRDELVGVSSKSNIFMKKMDEVLKEEKIIKEDLTMLQQEVQQMIADIQSLKDQNTKLKADLERLRVELETTKKKQNLYIIIAMVLGLVGAAK